MAERPGYHEFNDRKWETLSAVMWATLGREIRDQPDQLAALAVVTCPTLVIVGVQDEPFVGRVARDGGDDPGCRARRDPRRGSLAAVREPGAVAHRARAVPRSGRPPRPVSRSLTPVTQELGSGGKLAAEVLGRHDVDTVFTLSGGHLFPFYDGCVQTDIRLVDVRHEQTATFAAEGWAKVTRRVGVCALTAGPGVTNGVSALTAAQLSGSPDARDRRARAGRALGVGLAPGARPGPDPRPGGQARGDRAHHRSDPGDVRRGVARRPHTAPRLRPSSMSRSTSSSTGRWPRSRTRPSRVSCAGGAPDPEAVATIATLIAEAAHPVLVAGR